MIGLSEKPQQVSPPLPVWLLVLIDQGQLLFDQSLPEVVLSLTFAPCGNFSQIVIEFQRFLQIISRL
jgi:hypothetical protein